ncbi:mitochondrial import receptor subunit TOM70-like [Lineus longissimus]|uniref:mitochondrial import receptor subunit TOM70-like n=1 Tax=Lineus longissimus TaxID=88925 RepID=UPI002B4EF054
MASNMSKGAQNVTGGLSKWQVALAVGAPVALGLAGLWYYKKLKAKPEEEPSLDKLKDVEAVKKEEQKPLTPVEKANAAKNKGNKYFKAGQYDKAIECYSEAIKICPAEHKTELSTFYQNRAAGYEQLKNTKKVIEDCNKALEYNSRYTKALFRRAKACETENDLSQSLEDVTAVCILEGFQNQMSLRMADRVLKEIGRTKAKEAFMNRRPILPSQQFIRTYFSAFANDPIMNSISDIENIEVQANDTTEKDIDGKDSSPYQQAKQCLAARVYDNIVKLCTEEIENEMSPYLAESLLLRATVYLLLGEGVEARKDLDRVLDMNNLDQQIRTNALIKLGSLKMQNEEKEAALADFAAAAKDDPENSDIYHHRGQLHLLLERVEEALKDFDECVKLNPNFPIAQVQKCYAEYRYAFTIHSPMQLQSAIKSFEETVHKFPKCAEGFALYGQSLCDQQLFEKSDEFFLKALEIEPDNANIYVHRGLLRIQWRQDMEGAAKLITKAIEVDDKCEFAYETLGTIEVQRGNLDGAIEHFNKAIKLAKTEIEMSHLFSLLDAAIAQAKVARNFGIQFPSGTM